MYEVLSISTLDLPELKPYRTMRLSTEHQRDGIFVAEGDKVVQRFLEGSFEVISLLLEHKWFDQFKPLIEQRPENIKVYIADRKELERLTGYPLFQGALAVGRIPPSLMLLDLVARTQKPRFFVAVEGVSNAINMGVIVRNCVAFGVQGLILGETCASPYLRRAVRNSMGAIFHLPIVETASLSDALSDLRSGGILCVAAHPHTDKKTVMQADLKQDCCVVFGSEGYGLSKSVLEVCNEHVVIPTTSLVDSLNVANAAGIFLYEVYRQRAG
jgi:tRNA G18 (ribose-2'-O)-methylase SpoU